MSYEEAKAIVEKFVNGIPQPLKIVSEACEIISEEDFDAIKLKLQTDL